MRVDKTTKNNGKQQ